MIKYSKSIATALIVFISVLTLTGCGAEEEKNIVKSEIPELSGTVKIAAASDCGYDVISQMPSDYSIIEYDDQWQVKMALVTGQCDMAVLTPIEAFSLYNITGGFNAITTLATGDWKVVSAGDLATVSDEGLAYLSGKRITGYAENPLTIESSWPVSSENDKVLADDEKSSEYTQNETVNDANLSGEKNNVAEDINIPAETDEMGGVILQTLMEAEKLYFYDYQISWKKSAEYMEQLSAYSNVNDIVLMPAHETIDNIRSFEIVDLASLWQEKFKSDIPKYILVATDSFMQERGTETATVMKDFSDMLDDNQKNTDEKLVSYTVSDRGIALIRDFAKVLEKYNSQAIGGKAIPSEFFYDPLLK